MTKRRKSREVVLQLLYQQDFIRDLSPDKKAKFMQAVTPSDDIREFVDRLLTGIANKREKIDKILSEASKSWSINRMPAVDRNILRIGIFEILYCNDIPGRVTIDEAVELCKKFGSEKSSMFINGILDNIAKESDKLK